MDCKLNKNKKKKELKAKRNDAEKESSESSESAISTIYGVSNVSKCWRERRHESASFKQSSDSSSDTDVPKTVEDLLKCGSRYPPMTSQYVDVRKPKKELENAKKTGSLVVRLAETDDLNVEAANYSDNCTRTASRASVALAELSAEELYKRLGESVAIIWEIAQTCKGLKKSHQKTLKQAASGITEAVEEIYRNIVSDEVYRLQIEKAHLEREKCDMKKELDTIRSMIVDGEQLKQLTKPVVYEASESNPIQVFNSEMGNILQRVQLLEDRILDSPPAFYTNATRSFQITPESYTEEALAPVTSQSAVSSPEPKATDDQWQTVGAKNAAKKIVKTRPKEPKKLLAAQSSAAIITVQPEAENRDITCAETKVRMDDFAIEEVPYKTIISSARLLEIPGAQSSPVADAPVEKFRKQLPEKNVCISRPTKRASLRLIGLDESMTNDELLAAVAKYGECPDSQIKIGPIKNDATNIGMAVLSCPLATAQKIMRKKVLPIGWIVADVQLLVPRPLRVLNQEVLLEATEVQSSVLPPSGSVNVQLEADLFQMTMMAIRDAPLPRARRGCFRPQPYWWSEEIAQLRRTYIAARRQYTRHRGRRRLPVDAAAREEELYTVYTEAKKTFQIAVKEAKVQAREELLPILNPDL